MYTGYKEVTPTDLELNMFYSAPEVNLFDCRINEYLVLYDNDKNIIDRYKWNGIEYQRLKYKIIDNTFSGKIRPKNVQQQFTFDMLQDEISTIKILSGRFGSGKSMLMITHALDLIEKGKFDKLVWVRNNIEVKDTTPLGCLPGLI